MTSSYEDLKDAVKADGVYEVTMEDLKAIQGAGRLRVTSTANWDAGHRFELVS